MSGTRTLAIDTTVFERIAGGDLRALVTENERFRQAVVDNVESAKLENQPPEPDVAAPAGAAPQSTPSHE